MTTRHELPTHLGTVNKPFLGLALSQFFALVGAVAGGVILAGHLPITVPLLARLAAGVLFAGVLTVLILLRPAGKTLLEWGRIVRVYAGQARVTVWHHEGSDR
jgi:hypothetical protein